MDSRKVKKCLYGIVFGIFYAFVFQFINHILADVYEILCYTDKNMVILAELFLLVYFFFLFTTIPEWKHALKLLLTLVVVLLIATTVILSQIKTDSCPYHGLRIPEPEIFPTPDDPIALPSTSIEVVHRKEFAFTVGFFNNCDTAFDSAPILNCRSKYYTDVHDGFNAKSFKQRVPPGESRDFKFISEKKAPPAGNIIICTIQFNGTGDCRSSKQITIKST